MSKKEKDLGERWYKPKQVAEKLGVGTSRVLGWIHSGRVEAVDLNQFEGSFRPNYRISETALGELMKEKQVSRPGKMFRPCRKPPSQRRYG